MWKGKERMKENSPLLSWYYFILFWFIKYENKINYYYEISLELEFKIKIEFEFEFKLWKWWYFFKIWNVDYWWRNFFPFLFLTLKKKLQIRKHTKHNRKTDTNIIINTWLIDLILLFKNFNSSVKKDKLVIIFSFLP